MSSAWREVQHTDGRTYYFNAVTNQTQWTKPIDMMGPVDQAIANQPWREYKTPEGRKYWSHEQTKQSVWDMPESYKNALEAGQRIENSQRAQELTAAPQFVAGGTSTFSDQLVQSSNNQFDDYVNQDRILAITDGSENRPSHVQSDKNDPQYNSYADAEAAFFKLLKRSNVGADWTWEQTMKATIKEPQYKALKDPKDRKAAFEKYTAELRMQDLEKSKDRMAKLRQDFATMLKSHPEIKYYTRWRTARSILEGETIFKSAADDTERRSLFEEYIIELRKAHQDQEISDRKYAMEDLTVMLKSLDLEPYTRWSEAQGIIQESENFKSEPKFQALSKLDILNVFENHIKYLERSLNETRQKTKQVKSRRERKNREAYVVFLDQLQAKGEIRPGTKWKQIHKILKDDERYINMLGQPGSTPLDLFWDKMEEIDREVRAKRSAVLDVLEETRFQVTPKTTIDEFIGVLRNDSRTAKFTQDMYTVIFDKVREKSSRRGEEDRHQSERQQRRRVDALRSAIKHLDPPVTLADTWEQVKPRLLNKDEYRDLDSDELRESAFDKFIRRLKEKHEEDKEGDKRERKGSRGLDKVDKNDRERERSRPLGGRDEPPRDRHRSDKERDRERDRDRDRDLRDRERNRDHGGRDRERDRERERDRDRGERNGHHRGSGRSPARRTPEVDAYEAERRRAAGERERQHQKTGASSFPTSRGDRDRDRDRERDRHERDREFDPRDREGSRHLSIYERERREREEERERQYRSRDAIRDDVSNGSGKRRPRQMSPGDESDGSRRDPKRSRRERPRDRSPGTDVTMSNSEPVPKPANSSKEKPVKDVDEESEEGEIPE